MCQLLLLPAVWPLTWTRNYFCSFPFSVCCLRSETTVPAACTFPGFMFGILLTKHTLVGVNGKGNSDPLLTVAWPVTCVAATPGRMPCEGRPSYKVIVPTWLTGHRYSPHTLNFRSLVCPAQPPWGFVLLCGTGAARTRQAPYQDGTHVQNAIWTFTAEDMSMPSDHTHVRMAQLNLPSMVTVTLPSHTSMPSFVLSCALGCAVSATLGTPDRARSEWSTRENVADEQ